MNKIYRVVWNEAVNRWVVTSELGSSHKKSSKFKDKVLQVGALAFGTLFSLGVSAGTIYEYKEDTNLKFYDGMTPLAQANLSNGDQMIFGAEDGKQVKISFNTVVKGDEPSANTKKIGTTIHDASVNLIFRNAFIGYKYSGTTLFKFDFKEEAKTHKKDLYEIGAADAIFHGSEVNLGLPDVSNTDLIGPATFFDITTAYQQDFLLKMGKVYTAANPKVNSYADHGYGVIFSGVDAGKDSTLTVSNSNFYLERGTAIKAKTGGKVDVKDDVNITFSKYHSIPLSEVDNADIQNRLNYSIGIELDGDVTATSSAKFSVDNKTTERITLYDIKNGATLTSHSQTPIFAGHKYESFTGANIGKNAHFINYTDFNLRDEKQTFANLYGGDATVSNHGDISASNGVVFHIDESSAQIENDGEIRLTEAGQWIVYKGTGGETHAVKVIAGKVIVGDKVTGFTQNGLDNFTFTDLDMTVQGGGIGFNLDNNINISGQIALEGEGNQGLHLTGSETFTFNEGAESEALLITLNKGDQVAINVDRTDGLATLDGLKITGNAGTGIQVLNGDLLFKGLIEMEEGGTGLYLASTTGSKFTNEGGIHSDIRLGDGDNTFTSEKDGASVMGDIIAGSGSNTIAIHDFKGGMTFNNDANAESHNTVTLTGGTVSDIESKNGSLDLTLKDGVVVNGSLHANGDKTSELTLDHNDFRYDKAKKVTGFNEIDH